jgi:hypothetical protein
MVSSQTARPVERSNGAKATQAVAATQAQAPVSQAGFTDMATTQPTVINAPGQHVAHSADPGALWGGAPAEGLETSPEIESFRKLTPDQMRAKLDELRGDRDQLTGAIQQRIGELDKRWGRMQNKTRARALGEYRGKSRHLDRRTGAELAVLVAAAEKAQAQIDSLNAQVKALPKDSKTSCPEKRAQLARDLRAQRKALSQAVDQATQLVDTKGLKVDRLAETETIIDPSAAKKPESETLLGMVKKWFTLDWIIGKCSNIYDATLTQWMLQRHTEQVKDQIRQEDIQQKETQQRRLMEEILTNYRNTVQGIPKAK